MILGKCLIGICEIENVSRIRSLILHASIFHYTEMITSEKKNEKDKITGLIIVEVHLSFYHYLSTLQNLIGNIL